MSSEFEEPSFKFKNMSPNGLNMMLTQRAGVEKTVEYWILAKEGLSGAVIQKSSDSFLRLKKDQLKLVSL